MTARLAQLWRSMPLRLAVLLVALFTAVSLLSLAASYSFTPVSYTHLTLPTICSV